MATKNTKIFDLNLFSGSSELIRQSLGGYYYDPASDGQIDFFESNIDNVVQIENIDGVQATINNDFVLPKYTFGNRIFVNEADSSFVSDENWKVFIVGGEYGGQNFPGIYNNNVYSDHYNTSKLPLVPRELVNTSETPSLTLTTEYFQYYPSYQSVVTNVESVTNIPNYYLLPSNALDLAGTENSAIDDYQYLQIQNYLTNSYVNSDNSVDLTQKNIFVLHKDDVRDQNGTREDTTSTMVSNYGADSDLNSLYSLMPFGNKLEFSGELTFTSRNRYFHKIIADNNYNLKLLKTLKETFQNENRLRTSTVNFAVNTEAPISTGTTTSTIEKTQTVPIKLVDALTMLLYAYRNPDSETQDISIVNSASYTSEMNCAFDTEGIYRYENTQKSLSVFNSFVETIKDFFEAGTGSIGSIEDFMNQASNPKLHQTLAFRIQKIGGPPTGDSNTQNTIQNIWIYNDQIGGLRTYFDSQVKYDTNYTYKIFKYDIVMGTKYQLTNISTTRQIDIQTSDNQDAETGDYYTEYCLEFYDPFTGQTVPSIFEAGRIAGDTIAIENEIEQKLSEIEDRIIDYDDLLEISIDRLLLNISDEQVKYMTNGSAVRAGAETVLRTLFQINTYSGERTLPQYFFQLIFPYLLDQSTRDGSLYQFSEIASVYFRMINTFIETVRNRDDNTGISSTYDFLADPFFGNPTVLADLRDDYQQVFSFSPYSRPSDFFDDIESALNDIINDFMIEIPTAYYDRKKRDFTVFSGLPGSPAIDPEKQLIDVVYELFKQVYTYSTTADNVHENRMQLIEELEQEITLLRSSLETTNDLATTSQIVSRYPYLSEFNLNFEPSVKILEIPIETKSMRIVDHPPNDLVITPHHLLDQSNRLAFYCKYDTFSVNTMTYPPTLGPQDEQNRDAYLTGHDFLSVSKQTQESVSPARFIEVYRVTEKPTSYADFTNNLRKTIDLKMENGDIPGDHIFTEAVQTNKKYYYVFRPVNDNGVGGQLSPVFESELIDDGGYVYANFVQYSEDDLAVPPPKQPLTSFKKLVNIIPNIQHVQLDTSAVTFASSSFSQMSDIHLGTQAEDTLWDADKYFKIRLTSKKTGKKMDLNIVFDKKERK
jgi:hypothetical protein